jgi:CDP-diacylglycerol--glycerol-3-phosphate 3-phosphatidyltransferase
MAADGMAGPLCSGFRVASTVRGRVAARNSVRNRTIGRSIPYDAMFPVNVPNVLTVLRILLVPVLVVALLGATPSGDLFAAIVFVVASLTDLLDGYLARTRNAVTTFGKLMDPIADKLLIVAALVSLVSLHRVAAWVAMVIIAREFAVTALRMAATQQGVVIAASMFGKAKTCLQIAAVLALIVAGDPTPAWADALVYVTVAVTVLSGADYFLSLRRRLGERDRAAADRAG